MGIVIESLTINVKGNVVKNNDENGDTVLRASQEQAREIYEDLAAFFAKNSGGNISGGLISGLIDPGQLPSVGLTSVIESAKASSSSS